MKKLGKLAIHYVQSVLMLGLVTLYPLGAGAGELTTVSTDGFSVSFTDKWLHVETMSSKSSGTINAGPKGEEPPAVSISYVDLSASPTAEEHKQFETFQKSSIEDHVGGAQKLERLLKESSWHSDRETVQLKPGLSVDRQDIEGKGKDNKSIERANCFFLRRYHAPHAEVFVMFADDKTCKEARPDFEGLEASFNWK